MRNPRKIVGRGLSVLEILLLVLLALSAARLFSGKLFDAGGLEAAGGAALEQDFTPCPGDANLDLQRDIRDVVLIQAHILKKRLLSGDALANADVNGDLAVDVRDMVGLIQHILGSTQLGVCQPGPASDELFLRFVAPTSGPPGTAFTLTGHGFSPVAAENTVLFFQPEAIVQAQVVSASENVIQGLVPAGLENRLHAVTVTVDGRESNAVGFEVGVAAAPLRLFPDSATVLMPPGSGRELLVIGGGTPPYKLKPLSEAAQQIATAQLTGTIIEVIGVNPGSLGIEVEDGAEAPATSSSNITVREPAFAPFFDITPHTLLAGSSPGFSIQLRQSSGHMRLDRTEIRFEKTRPEFSQVQENDVLGLSQDTILGAPNYQFLQASGGAGMQALRFDLLRQFQNQLIPTGQGTLEPGSSRMTLVQIPRPLPEWLVRSAVTTDLILTDGLIRLPDSGNESFQITATFTSTSTAHGRVSPLTATVARTFQTVVPQAGAPRLMRLLPFQGEVGRKVVIHGSGFDPAPENNRVTFSGEGDIRVEAPVLAAGPEELIARVPAGAVSGPVRVVLNGMESNDFQFQVLFRPNFGLYFPEEEGASNGTSLSPLIHLSQESGEVSFAGLRGRVTGAVVDPSGLEAGEPAGTASLVNESSGLDTVFHVIYGGQDGDGRHFFDLMETPECCSRATIFVAESDGGVDLEMIPNGLSVVAHSLTVEFDKILSRTDDSFQVFVEVRSVRWNFFPGTEMVVVTGGEIP